MHDTAHVTGYAVNAADAVSGPGNDPGASLRAGRVGGVSGLAFLTAQMCQSTAVMATKNEDRKVIAAEQRIQKKADRQTDRQTD